jgi:hypothetical protein
MAATLAFTSRLRAVMIQTMAAAGYHQHARGIWRRRREGVRPQMDLATDQLPLTDPPSVSGPTDMSPGTEERDPASRPGSTPSPDASVRAENPVGEDRPELELDWEDDDPLDAVARRLNGEGPRPREPEEDPAPKPPSRKVLRRVTALGYRAEDEWVRLTAGRDYQALSLIRDDLAALRVRLGEPDDPPLVQLLIDQYVTEWTRRTFFSIRLSETIDRQVDHSTRELFRRGVDDADWKLMQLTTRIATVRGLLRKTPPPKRSDNGRPETPSPDGRSPATSANRTSSPRSRGRSSYHRNRL